MTSADSTVVIVDDEPDLLDEFIETINGAGLLCAGYQHAQEAISRVRDDSSVDILITDHRMPGISGIDVVRQLLAETREPRHLQIIMITGHAFPDIINGAFALNIFDFLRKPVLANTILDCIRAARHYRRAILL